MEKILEQPTAKATGSEVQFVMRSEPKPKVSAQYLSQLPCTDCRCPIPTIVIRSYHFLFSKQAAGPQVYKRNGDVTLLPWAALLKGCFASLVLSLPGVLSD